MPPKRKPRDQHLIVELPKDNILLSENNGNSSTRQADDSSDSQTKKIKFETIGALETSADETPWVSASSVHNYILGDPLVDWLNMKKKQEFPRGEMSSFSPSQDKIDSAQQDQKFMNYLMEQGVKFEAAVVNYLKKKIDDICDVAEDSTWIKHNIDKSQPLVRFITICDDFREIKNNALYAKTIKMMESGALVIYQGVVRNYENNTHGIPDLIIRSDFVNFLFPNTIPAKKIFKRGWTAENGHEYSDRQINTNTRFYYVIADIKFSNLKLRADGIHLLNSGRIPCYKAQIMIYNAALAYMQRYEPEFCFMLGRGYNYICRGKEYRSYDCDEKLGVIAPYGIDAEYNSRIDKAVQWRRDLVIEGSTWQVLPQPSREELYPNMANKYDCPFHKQKNEIAHELSEITMLWNCGLKSRQNCLKRGISSWRDPRCTTETLGINGPWKKKMIDYMLDFNRNPAYANQNIFYGDNYNPAAWWMRREFSSIEPRSTLRTGFSVEEPPSPKSRVEFYIDFENITNIVDNMDKIPHIGGVNLIYMIGVGYEAADEYDHHRWHYKCFYAPTLNLRGEYEMMEQFHSFISEFADWRHNVPVFYHWGSAEQSLYTAALKRHPVLYSDYDDLSTNFFDFLGVIKDGPILIKNVFGFSLKSYGKALYDIGAIQTKWEESCGDGMYAMLLAANCYKTHGTETAEFNNIIKYNEIDCKVLYEIVQFLRG